MDHKELRRELERGNFSQRRMARVLGLDERTMRRYCCGERPIPTPVEIAVRCVIDYMPTQEIEARLAANPDKAPKLEGRKDNARRSRYR